MIRLAITPRAYRAIKAFLPEGSVVYPARGATGATDALP